MSETPPLGPDEPRPDAAQPHPGLYSPSNLRRAYTPLVIGLSHPLLWRVSNRTLHRLYADRQRGAALTAHAEVGPGNGHFLARLPAKHRPAEVHLIDVHTGPLVITAQRLARASTKVYTHQASALEDWGLSEPMQSVGSSMMVHCLPGETLFDKSAFFDNAAASLAPQGRFFGATILGRGEGVRHTRLSRRMMAVYQDKGWFSNSGDSSEDLHHLLADRFDEVTLTVHGGVGVWSAVARG